MSIRMGELGRVPFSAVWVARGTIKDTGRQRHLDGARADYLGTARRAAGGGGRRGTGWISAGVAGRSEGLAARPCVWAGRRHERRHGEPQNRHLVQLHQHVGADGGDFAQSDHKLPPPDNPDGQGKYYAVKPMSVPVRITDNRAVKVEKLILGEVPEDLLNKFVRKDEARKLARRGWEGRRN